MRSTAPRLYFQKARLIILPAVIAASIGFFLTRNSGTPVVEAFSSGPPAGFTGAPSEFTCAECHVPDSAGTGHISITAPQTYVPGQTYPITVTHTNVDPTRLRWGFELTALDESDERAGNLQNLDGLTQVLNNQGPGGARQYIEHTAAGTFVGQQGGASWTFNWTAPPTDVGPVTFYAAGNQANNDGNTSGDFIYFTFVSSAPASTSPDFAVSVTPQSRSVTPGNNAQYTCTITALAGFTGTVTLAASGLPAGASASFSPSSVVLSGAASQTSILTIATTPGTPLGDNTINVTATSGATMHAAQAVLRVISPASIDLDLSNTASPNPGQVGASLAYRVVVTNNGPGAATNVNLVDSLPAVGANFVSVSTSQGVCGGTGPVNCALGNLSSGTTAIVTIIITPTASGTISSTATVSAAESDFDASNNTATVNTLIQPVSIAPSMLDPNLVVTTLIAGLNQPISMAFLGPGDFLVLEKASGKVQRVVNGTLQGTVLDLPVNSASERGLLGIALHPHFNSNGFVYLYWTESTTGQDTVNTDEIPLLGNRVDRYHWNGTTLTFDRNLIRLRSLQADSGQPTRGNHNGGVLRFGSDGKLYIIMGDNGRRGLLQNLSSGGPVPDDQFGGPQPDDAHLTGIVLRLNDDGTTPADNPFVDANTGLSGEAAGNVKKIFAYGIRNGFGMAFDPLSGTLWTQENGDDAFDEMNRVTPGFNGGWIQAMGPLSRIDQFKSIESTYGAGNLQQLRWPPANIADTPQQALSRLYMLPGASYHDPEFSWKYAVAPAAMGFVRGRGLGPQFEGDMFVGASRTTLLNGYLFRFKFTEDRQHFAFDDFRLTDRVADNNDKFDIGESESLLIGRDFGITTDIETGPDGNVYVVSLSNGAVYQIKSKPNRLFIASLTGGQEVPPTSSAAIGTATLLLSPDETTARVSLNFSGLASAQTDAHIHGPAPPGTAAPVVFPLPVGQINDFEINLSASQSQDLKNGLYYINVHSTMFPTGEIRGQFQSPNSASSFQLGASSFRVNEGEGSALISVTRVGDVSTAANVDYATADGTASNRTDYITTTGTLHFLPGETGKTFTVPIVDDLNVEGPETINIILSRAADGAFLGSPSRATLTVVDNDTTTATSNPLDDPQFFVNQHYLDILNREPDTPGLAYWTNQISSCGNDAVCIVSRRVGVSAAFFVESEFQESGGFVFRLYRGTLGRDPHYDEFTSDRSRLITGDLAASKQQLVTDFMARPEFTTRYPVGSDFIGLMIQTAKTASGSDLVGLESAMRQSYDTCIGGNSAAFCRGSVIQLMIDDGVFRQAVYNRSFVLMEYFGYLRRDPDAGGYTFWLDILNNRVPNNYRSMVCAFISSAEYQQRFSPVVTRSDQQCAGVGP